MQNKFDKDLKLLQNQHRDQLQAFQKQLTIIHQDRTPHQSEQNLQVRTQHIEQVIESCPTIPNKPTKDIYQSTNDTRPQRVLTSLELLVELSTCYKPQVRSKVQPHIGNHGYVINRGPLKLMRTNMASFHPFMVEVIKAQLPNKWKRSCAEKYNDSLDLKAHVKAYVTQLNFFSKNLGVHCKLFPTTLKELVLE